MKAEGGRGVLQSRFGNDNLITFDRKHADNYLSRGRRRQAMLAALPGSTTPSDILCPDRTEEKWRGRFTRTLTMSR
jgi:hypothetical protein